MPDDEVKNAILDVFEASLDAQLRAVRRLRRGEPTGGAARRARTPLHIAELLTRLQMRFGVAVDRESLVSSLTKKVARGDRFTRTEKNTFGLRPEGR